MSVDHKNTEAGRHQGSGFRLSAIADYGFSTALDDLVDDSVQLFSPSVPSCLYGVSVD